MAEGVAGDDAHEASSLRQPRSSQTGQRHAYEQPKSTDHLLPCREEWILANLRPARYATSGSALNFRATSLPRSRMPAPLPAGAIDAAPSIATRRTTAGRCGAPLLVRTRSFSIGST